MECSNYRTISLKVHASKVLLKFIKGRIKLHYDREMADNRLVLWKEKELENKQSISGLLLRTVETNIYNNYCICVSLIMRRHLTV